MSNQMYPTQGPMYQLQRIDINNPPYIPNIQCAGTIAPYLAYLTGMTMDMIQNGAQGPISFHFLNHMIDNGWRNPDFDREIANIADFIFLKSGGQQLDSRHVGQMFPDLIGMYLNLRSMYEVHIYPGLWNNVQQQDRMSIENDHRTFMAEISQIHNLRQRNSGGPVHHAPQANTASMYPPPNQGHHAPPPPYGVPGGGYAVNGGAPGGGRDYGTTATTPMQPAPAPYQPPPSAPTPPQPAPAKPQQGAPVIDPNATIVDAASTPWNPSPEMPYPAAYNPLRISMKYLLQNGKTLPHLQKNEINMIDFNRHNIDSLFGKPPAQIPVLQDNSEAMRDLQHGINDAREEDLNVDGDGNRVEFTHALNSWAAVTTLEGAIQDIRTDAAAHLAGDDSPKVFQAYAQVFTPIMGRKSETELVKKLADSSTYIELREKLKAAGETASVELVSEIGLMLTEHMNHILHKELSISPDGPSKLVVDDFITDLDPLLKHLETAYSDRVLKAFLKEQGKRIKSLFQTLDPEAKDQADAHRSLSETMLTESWAAREDLPVFTYFGRNIRVTLLDMISHDLQLGGLPKVGNLLTKVHTPVLLELAEALYDSEDSGRLIARQLVVTKDGRIFEVTRAALIEGSYLVSLVK